MPKGTVAALAAATLLQCLSAQAQTNPGLPESAGASAPAGTNSAFAGKQDVNGDISSQHVTPIGGSARTLASRLGDRFSVADFPAIPTDGTTDAAAALQAALNQISSSGGGTLDLLHARIAISGASLTIPRNVTLTCSADSIGEQFVTKSLASVACALLLSPSYTINVGANSTLSKVAVLRQGAAIETDVHKAIAQVNAFAGVGITITGNDATVEDATVIGFQTCFSDNGQYRALVRRLDGDCTNGLLANENHDVTRFHDVHFWPFLNAHAAPDTTYFVAGAANNGNGIVRLTLTAAASPSLVSGDTVALFGVLGLPVGLYGRQGLTVVDSTHIDLPNVAWPAPVSETVALTAGSAGFTATNTAPLGIGMTVTGPGIPSGTVIAGFSGSAVALSNAVTVTNASANISIAPTAGVSSNSAGQPSGQVMLEASYRGGTGFTFQNSENTLCESCFAYGYAVGMNIGDRAGWTMIRDVGIDSVEDGDPAKIGIQVTGGAYDTMISGGYISSAARAFISAASAGPATKVTGVSFNNAQPFTPSIFLYAGDVIIEGSTLAPESQFGPGSIYVSDGMDSVILSANNFGAAPVSYQSLATPSKVQMVATIHG